MKKQKKKVAAKRKISFVNSQKSEKIKKVENEVQLSWFCKICDEDKQEHMIQCLKCRCWYHTLCAGVKPTQKMYYCTLCKD